MSVNSGPNPTLQNGPKINPNQLAETQRRDRVSYTQKRVFLEPLPREDSKGNIIPLEVRSNPDNDVEVSAQDLLQRLKQIQASTQASAQTSSPKGPGFTQGTGNYPERGLSIPNQAYNFAESNRIITSLIGGYKTEIDRQIASLENRKPPLSKLEKEKQKKYREIFKKIFDILENQTINVGNILQDTNLMSRLSNVVINYPSKTQKPGDSTPYPYRGVNTVNGLKEYYNHMIFIIEALGSIIDHSNFPAPFRVRTGKDSVSLKAHRRDSQGNYIDSGGQILDHVETFVMLSAINGNLEPVANNLVDLEGNTREEQLQIDVRPRNHSGTGGNKAASRAWFTFNNNDKTYNESRAFARIDLDKRDSNGVKDDTNGIPTVTLDLEFPTAGDIFTYYPVLVNGRNVNLYEMDPALHDFVIRLHSGLGGQSFTHHFSTGITFNNAQEFTEFMRWILGSLHN